MNARADIDWHNVTTYGNDYKTMAYRPIGTAPPVLNYDLNTGEWARMRTKIGAFKKLTTNWDDEGGEAPEHEVVDSVLSYLLSLQRQHYAPPVRVAVTPEGGVFVEWQLPDFYMDIESHTVGEAAVLCVPAHGPAETYKTRWAKPEAARETTVSAAAPIDWNKVIRAPTPHSVACDD